MSRRPVGHAGARCGAKNRDGSTCKHEAGWATDHLGEGPCKTHGGCTPTVARGAKLRLVEREASTELARLDVLPVSDALTELAKLAGQVLAWRNALADKVNELTSIRYESVGGGEQLREEVALFERAMDRCINVLGTIARLKIDERLVRIEQQRVDLVADALAATLNELQLDPDARQQATDGLVRRLRLASG